MNIRVAAPEDMARVWALTYKTFLAHGFCMANRATSLRNYHSHLDGIAETTVLLAEDENGLAGTISVTEDSSYKLHVDETFPGAVMTMRHHYNGARFGAAWRLATRAELETSPDARRAGKVLVALIGAALEECVRRKLDAVCISVHPDDAGFYEQRLGFKEVDRVDHDPTVNNAPAVLMLGRLEAMLKKWKRKR